MKESKVFVNEKEKGFFGILFDLFRSLKLTITLLILLAILSIIGTVITQNATSKVYIQHYGDRLYELLNFFNLFDMFHSWWFRTILFLLAINLITCSLHRFSGIWRQIFPKTPLRELNDSMFKTLPYVEKMIYPGLDKEGIEQSIQLRLRKWFKRTKVVETESSILLFSEKGRFSRLGVPITHLSILIILLGGLLGSMYGLKGFVNILKGETVDQIDLRVKDEEVKKKLPFSVRCNDFNIAYYDLPGQEKYVKEYASDLTILENGKEVLRKTVMVNHPLHYKGLALYQASYGSLHDVTLGVRRKNQKEKILFNVLEGETIPVPNSNVMIQFLRYIPQVHNFGEGVQVTLLLPQQAPRTQWVLKGSPKFESQQDGEFLFSLEGVTSRPYTGLQVAKDPGSWAVWAGCSLMILGLIVSLFFSHERVWVKIPKGSMGEMIVAGSTNKNQVSFEETFRLLVDGIRSDPSPSHSPHRAEGGSEGGKKEA